MTHETFSTNRQAKTLKICYIVMTFYTTGILLCSK